MNIKQYKESEMTASEIQQHHQKAIITISQIATGWLVKCDFGWFAFPSMAEVCAHLTKITKEAK